MVRLSAFAGSVRHRCWPGVETLEDRETPTLRIVTYNIAAATSILPRPNIEVVLRAIRDESGSSVPIDVLALQEVSSNPSDVNHIVDLLNAFGDGTYDADETAGATNGGGTQMLVYRTSTIQVLGTTAVGTISTTGQPRQTLRYHLRATEVSSTADFYLYNSHFKADDTPGDRLRRDIEAVAIRQNADALGEGANIIYVGDFNAYRSSEAFYNTTLLGPGPGQAIDPIGPFGTTAIWTNNPIYRYIHTQSPADGTVAGLSQGNMNDRFDFQLFSGELRDGAGLEYVENSYNAFGNNGSTFGQAINSGNNTIWPPPHPLSRDRMAILDALATVSDHLPVVADYTIIPASITVTHGSSVDVAEAGATDFYTLVLSSAPSANVNITLNAGSQLTVSPSVLIFTPANWNTAQTATINAFDDAVDEGNHSGTITHTVTSVDAGYNAVMITAVTANIADDDRAGISVVASDGSLNVSEAGTTDYFTVVLYSSPTANVFITLTPDSQISVTANILTFTPVNWSVTQTVTVQAIDDAGFVDALQGILTPSVSSADPNFSVLSLPPLTADILDNDLPPGVTIVEIDGATEVTEGGSGDTLTVQLDNLPTANVVVTLAPDAQAAVVPTLLTFTPLTWSNPQTVTVTAVNDLIAEGSHIGVITHAASSGDPNYNNIAIASITASIIDAPSLIIIQTSGTTDISESGTTDAYSVVLASQPTANVVVTITPGTQVTVSAATLTFTPVNWNVSQNVTVTAVNDVIAEGAHSGVIAHTSSSTDPNYNGIPVSVTANITDNDTPGITITQTAGSTNVAESGTTDTYLVVLATQPTANVLVTLNAAASLTTSPTVLTFTTATWNTTQTVTVTAIDDVVFQGPHTGVIAHTSTSADALYNALAIASVTANIADNDATPGISLTQPGSPQEGGSTTYTIVLQTAPAANVTINLTPDAQVNVGSPSLVFTPADWNVPQTVTVSTINDTLPELNQTGIITHAISSADAAYNSLTIAPITVHIVDNDGTLVLGTERDDRILVNFLGTRVQAIVNGEASYLPGPITQILVLANEGNDFIQITAPTVPVVVLGGSGDDAVWVVGSTGYNTFLLDSTSVTLNNKTVSIGEAESFVLGGRTSNDTFRIQNLPLIPTELKGDHGNDNVLAPDTDNAWKITAPSGGSLNDTLTLNAVENWYGGTGADTFTFADKKSVGGKIDGGGGNDTLDYSAYTAPVAVNLQTRVATGTKTIANIASLVGGLVGDKLIGADQSNAWSLTDNNTGDVNGILFAGFENLTGGKLDDAFAFADGIGVTGKIDGGAGLDALDYSGYSAAVAIHLQAKTATATGGMLNFEQFVGGADIDTLTGANVVNKWTFTASGSGTLNKSTFSEFENFTGGSSTDTFTLANSLADWLGTLDGKGGRDSLLSFTAGVNLWTNGATGAGTLNGRAFAGIELRR